MSLTLGLSIMRKALNLKATPLFLAASSSGQHDFVSFLIELGSDVNEAAFNETKKEQITPLVAAAKENHLATVQVLLANGAKPDNCDQVLWHSCSEDDRLEMVRTLLDAGAKCDLKKTIATSYQNYTGLTRLMSLVLMGNGAVIDVFSKCIDRDTVNYAACGRLENQFEFNITAAWLASESGLTDILDTLLELGADANAGAVTREGVTLSCL